MSNDLEKFLQQAAERLAQKKAASGSSSSGSSSSRQAKANRGSSTAKVQRNPQSPSSPRTIPVAEVIEAEVIEPGKPAWANRSLGPDPISNIDTRPALAQEISQADEKMGDHVHQVFDHELSHLKNPSNALQNSGQSQGPQVTNLRGTKTHPLVQMLNNPESARNAFLVSEIFRRPDW